MVPEIQDPFILSSKDTGRLYRFLMPRAESSLMLLSNARLAGLEYRGRVLQGTYAAYRDGDSISGVAAHYWNGMVFLQAPENPARLFSAVIAASGRECTGIAGPYGQVQAVLPEILKSRPRPSVIGRDTLFALSLDDLVIPGLLQEGEVVCRHPGEDELPAMIDLRLAFMQEHLGTDLRPSHEKEARDLVTTQHREGSHWILEKAGKTVAVTAFSAGIPGIVQPGGVYTIPECRNRGYGRAVVAGSLIEARSRGAKKAVLFTRAGFTAAVKMYRALGFRPIGEYGLVVF